MAHREQLDQKFAECTSPDFLRQIFDDHVVEKGTIGRDGTKPTALREHIGELAERLSVSMREGTHRFTAYRQDLIQKGPGKPPRVISVPTARDQIVLRALREYLVYAFPEARPRTAQSKIRELMPALEDRNLTAYVRVDVKDFYPSIPHVHLLTALSWRVDNPSAIALVKALCETPTVAQRASRPRELSMIGVPQGLSVSNVLAEIVMVPVDKALANIYGSTYCRYVDDMIVLCDERNSEDIQTVVNRHLQIAGVSRNPDKSTVGFTSTGFDYLGYLVIGKKISVRPGSVSRIEHAIARTFTRYRYAVAGAPKGGISAKEWPERCLRILEWRLNLLITGCIFEENRHGWLNYFSQINDLKLVKSLDVQVDKHILKQGLGARLKPKRFMRTFWAIVSPNEKRRKYAPNFDDMGPNEKRSLLIDFYLQRESDIRFWKDEEVDERFSRWMKRITSELDRDLEPISA